MRDTAITFEYDVPSVEEFAGRIAHTLEFYPYLVAQKGEEILGYAYVGRFKERRAYDWAVESSVYIAQNARRMGLGKRWRTFSGPRAFAISAPASPARTIPTPIRTTTACSSTPTWASGWWAGLRNAAASSARGTTWYGWKSISGRIRRIQRR